MLGTGRGGGKCCGKAIGEVDSSILGKNNLIKINGCCCFYKSINIKNNYFHDIKYV